MGNGQNGVFVQKVVIMVDSFDSVHVISLYLKVAERDVMTWMLLKQDYVTLSSVEVRNITIDISPHFVMVHTKIGFSHFYVNFLKLYCSHFYHFNIFKFNVPVIYEPAS